MPAFCNGSGCDYPGIVTHDYLEIPQARPGIIQIRLPIDEKPPPRPVFGLNLLRICINERIMKKIHIVLLVFIAASIAILISFLKTAATYETIAGARANPGKFVHVAAKLDKSQPLQYDAARDPNFLSFTAVDSTGQSMQVVYRNGSIENLGISERLVLEGRYQDDHFECKRVQTKCPSKYMDDASAAGKKMQESTSNSAK